MNRRTQPVKQLRTDAPGDLTVPTLPERTASLRVLRLPLVEECTGLKRSQIYALERAGKFPQRVAISEGASGWLEHEVQAYIAERAALRSPRPGAWTLKSDQERL